MANENEEEPTEIISLGIDATTKARLVRAVAEASIELGKPVSRAAWIRTAINYYLERGENVKCK